MSKKLTELQLKKTRDVMSTIFGQAVYFITDEAVQAFHDNIQSQADKEAKNSEVRK